MRIRLNYELMHAMLHYATRDAAGQKIVATTCIHKVHVNVDVYTAVYIYLTQVDCMMVVYWILMVWS